MLEQCDDSEEEDEEMQAHKAKLMLEGDDQYQ
jgi:hypothetical protein